MDYNKCVILLFDGARFDVFDNLLKADKLPNIKRYILSKGTFLKGYSSLPTTTGPAHIPFIYGIYPGKANVPGIRWFDKTTAKRNIMVNSSIRSYVGPGCFFMGTDVAKNYIPLYNYFSKPINIFGYLDRKHNIRIKTNKLQKILYYIFAHYTNKWEVVDYCTAQSVKRYIKQSYDFIFSLFPAIDEITHLYYPVHENVLRQYSKLDEFVGEIFNSFSDKELRKTLVFIVSDHGLSKTHTHIPLVNLSKEEGFSPIFYPKILSRKYDIAIMESGNAMAFIYFMEPVNNRPALYKEFNTVDKNKKFINRLLSHDGIDFIAYRIDNSSLVVRNKHGEIIFNFKENERIKLINSGDNPLEFKVDKDTILLNESLNFTMNTNYPDSIVQLRQLFNSNRTGDLVIFAKDGFDLRERYEWPEHRSSHGSLLKSHMEVPICTNIKLKSTSCRTVDIFPTILYKLGYNISSNIDGKVIH